MPRFTKQILIGFTIGILAAIPFTINFQATAQKPETPTIQPFHRDPPKDSNPDANTLLSATTSKKQVVGFFPYWNLDSVDQVDFSQLTTVYYFALDLNADGSFNSSDPGINKLNSSAYQKLVQKVNLAGARLGLTIINLDANSISQNINNPLRQQKIIDNTLKIMKTQKFQDLNIDLEYAGDPDPNLTKDFTTFVQKLTKSVHQQIPNSTVTLDAFADSITKSRIFDMKSLGQAVDDIVIMAYDIHRLESSNAGPISPLFGKGKYEYDITTSVNDYLTKVPADKILLGVPFYGYEWPVQDDQKGSFVISSPRGPEISSYKRSIETSQQNLATINFDDESKSAWFSYFDKSSKTWRQVWFENERSLGVKFDMVNDLKLGGIAVFALGYDGSTAQTLWDEVKLKLK